VISGQIIYSYCKHRYIFDSLLNRLVTLVGPDSWSHSVCRPRNRTLQQSTDRCTQSLCGHCQW